MALYVNTNVSSLNAKRMLNNSTNSLDTTYKRLASGLRINSAKDDAAGMQISNRLTSQINGLEQGNRNAQDGIAYAQTVEGAMDEMTTMYQRIRTLALQSANGTNSTGDREALQNEVDQLCAEIDRISNDTTFGGVAILNGGGQATVADDGNNVTIEEAQNAAARSIEFQVGADANQKISLEMTGKASKAADNKISVYENGAITTKDCAAGKANYGFCVASLALALGYGTTVDDTTGFKKNSTSDTGLSFDISTERGAQLTLGNIDNFIQAVDSKRAELGAVQNRLESTIRNQSNIVENVSDARSRIRDTDFATETANMTQQSIIQQASQSILSQANQRTQLALSLLG